MKKNVMLRDLKDFIDKKGNKPILSCVHFSKDGSITATDSHVLVTIHNYHKLTEDFNLNLVYFTQDTDEYPDTEHLLQLDSGTVEYSIRGDNVSKVVTWLKQHNMNKKQAVRLSMIHNNDRLVLDTDNDNYSDGIMLEGIAGPTKQFKTTLVQGNYLYSVFNLLSDYASGVDVLLDWWGPLRPMQLSSGDMTTLITPMMKVKYD